MCCILIVSCSLKPDPPALWLAFLHLVLICPHPLVFQRSSGPSLCPNTCPWHIVFFLCPILTAEAILLSSDKTAVCLNFDDKQGHRTPSPFRRRFFTSPSLHVAYLKKSSRTARITSPTPHQLCTHRRHHRTCPPPLSVFDDLSRGRCQAGKRPLKGMPLYWRLRVGLSWTLSCTAGSATCPCKLLSILIYCRGAALFGASGCVAPRM